MAAGVGSHRKRGKTGLHGGTEIRLRSTERDKKDGDGLKILRPAVFFEDDELPPQNNFFSYCS